MKIILKINKHKRSLLKQIFHKNPNKFVYKSRNMKFRVFLMRN